MANSTTTSDGTTRVDVSTVTPAEDTRTVLLNRVSWGAIFGGVVVALVIQFMLTLLGVGIGAATINPVTSGNPDAGTFSILAAIWYAVSAILASFAGGYVAARLSGRPLQISGALHGITTWALTTLVLLYLLTTTIGGLVGGALGGLSSLAGGVGSTVATAAQTAAPALAQATDPFAAIQQQIEQVAGTDDPAALQQAAVASIRAALTGDEAQAEQAREQAAQALSRAQNIPIEQARTQIDQYQQQYQQAVEAAQQKAAEVAESAANATSQGALLAFVALLVGAAAAWFGGQMGVVRPIVTSESIVGRHV